MAWIYMVYIVLIFISVLLLKTSLLKKKLPEELPGPKGIPIFGNIFQFEKHLHLQFTNWANQYGPVFGLDLAGTPAVVVSGKHALYEVLLSCGDDFSGRIHSCRTDVFPNVMFATELSPILAQEKKLLMTHLKGYGTGFKQLERIIMGEMDLLKNKIEGLCDSGRAIVPLAEHIENCVARIAAVVVFGHEVDEQDVVDMLKLTADIDYYTRPCFMGQMLDTFPFLRFFGHPYWNKLQKIISELDTMYQRVKHRTLTMKKNGEDMSTNYLYKYLELYEGENNLGVVEDNCRMGMFQAFAGVLNTTKKTMNTLISNMILHPHVQEKLRQESNDVLQGRKVTVKDRFDMPYHHAVILEITRMFPIIPLLVPHRAICDSEIAGYMIPKDTIIFPNVWALQHDENIWDEPLLFNPNRYLDDEGKLVLADHPARVNHLTFSAGPRVCAGESMATARMFLILATLIQNFELLPATSLEEQPPCGCYDMIEGFAISPPYYTARLKPRKLPF